MAEDDVDPFDAFMAQVSESLAKEEPETSSASKPDLVQSEEHHHQESSLPDPAPDIIPLAASQKPYHNLLLPALDHSNISYEAFRKDLYSPLQSVASLNPSQVLRRREQHNISVAYTNKRANKPIPAPVESFAEAGFDGVMLKSIARYGLDKPTEIQSQAIPLGLSGFDVIAVAKTGSGKTLAFVWPMVVHMMDQREIAKGEGPISIVLAPTRELAHQVYVQVKRYCTPYGCKACAIYGGTSKWEQQKALKQLCEVVVATPGRLIDMIKSKACKMTRVTFLVLDEADTMFSMGFEPQVRTIVCQIRPDRQTLLFSATFGRRVQALAHDVLINPVHLTVGVAGEANDNIVQVPVVVRGDQDKWAWFTANLDRLVRNGKVVVFVSTKVACEELTASINRFHASTPACTIHGDKSQYDRSAALRDFKAGTTQVLVATDVASRGLDIKGVNSVVCFDKAKNADTHVHRIGRTGRMKGGHAYVLLTESQYAFAEEIVALMQQAKQAIPDDLLRLAKRNPGFEQRMRHGSVGNNHGKGKKGRKLGHGSGRSDVKGHASRFVGMGYQGDPGHTQSQPPEKRGAFEEAYDSLINKRGLGTGVHLSNDNLKTREQIRGVIQTRYNTMQVSDFGSQFVKGGSVGGTFPDAQPHLVVADKPGREERNAMEYTKQMEEITALQRATRAALAARATREKVEKQVGGPVEQPQVSNAQVCTSQLSANQQSVVQTQPHQPVVQVNPHQPVVQAYSQTHQPPATVPSGYQARQSQPQTQRRPRSGTPHRRSRSPRRRGRSYDRPRHRSRSRQRRRRRSRR